MPLFYVSSVRLYVLVNCAPKRQLYATTGQLYLRCAAPETRARVTVLHPLGATGFLRARFVLRIAMLLPGSEGGDKTCTAESCPSKWLGTSTKVLGALWLRCYALDGTDVGAVGPGGGGIGRPPPSPTTSCASSSS
eukprot:1553946-Rhodomonas_salina.1